MSTRVVGFVRTSGVVCGRSPACGGEWLGEGVSLWLGLLKTSFFVCKCVDWRSVELWRLVRDGSTEALGCRCGGGRLRLGFGVRELQVVDL